MKCSKVHKLISPYIDGELPQQQMKTVEDHLKVCHQCRTEFEESRELHDLFAGSVPFKAPYGLHTRIMANVSPDKIEVNSRFPVFVRLAEAVAVVLFITIGIFSGSLIIKGDPQDRTGDVVALLSLDVFDPAPPGSLGGVYLAMTEVRNEK